MNRLIDKANRVFGSMLTPEANATSVFKRCHIKSITFDQTFGQGATGVNRTLISRGFIVMKTPAQFFSLSGEKAEKHMDDSYYGERLTKGRSIASPYLCVNFAPSLPAIVGHEGRHRMGAILKRYGDVAVPVGMYPVGKIRRNDLTNHHFRHLNGPVTAQNNRPVSPTGIKTIYADCTKIRMATLFAEYHKTGTAMTPTR